MESFLFYAVLFLIGASYGSFINVVALRLIRGEGFTPTPEPSSTFESKSESAKKEEPVSPAIPSGVWGFIRGRSHCVKCLATLHWYELVPVFSYLFLLGKCRHCQYAFGVRYILVEVLMGAYVSLLAYRLIHLALTTSLIALNSALLNMLFGGFFYFLLGGALFLIFLIDYDTKLILISLTRVVSFLGLAFLIYSAPKNSLLNFFFSLEGETILTAFSIGAFFVLIWTITKGKGMGLGDAELVFMLALFLPPLAALLMALLSFWIGALWGIGLILFSRHTMKSQIPFGPFLIFGFVIVFFWGDILLSYLGPFI